ncbi:hypothetical protein KAT36_00535 [Candidatus Pacearchaeota archaeon]|nr:hypothetical protein [Candidatus Pacearchaeota archaeon]
MRIRFEDVIFWILIAGIIGIVLWMLHGSPSNAGAIVGVGLFVAASELVLWKNMFEIERNTSIGFVKVKSEFKDVKRDLKEIKELVRR